MRRIKVSLKMSSLLLVSSLCVVVRLYTVRRRTTKQQRERERIFFFSKQTGGERRSSNRPVKGKRKEQRDNFFFCFVWNPFWITTFASSAPPHVSSFLLTKGELEKKKFRQTALNARSFTASIFLYLYKVNVA